MVANFLTRKVQGVWVLYLALAILECATRILLLTLIIPAMESLINLIPTVTNRQPLYDAILWFVLAHFLYECMWRIRDYVKIQFSTKIKFTIFNDLVEEIINYDLIFFRQTDTVGLVYITKHISDSSERILIVFIYMLRYLINLTLIPIKVFSISQACTPIILCWICLWLVTSWKMFQSISKYAINLANSKTQFLTGFTDTLLNIENVFVYKTYEHENTKLRSKLQSILDQDMGLQFAFWYLWVAQGTLFAIVIYIVLYTMGQSAELQAGKFVSMYQVINELSDTMWSSSDHILDFVEHYGRIRNGLDILSGKPILQLSNKSDVHETPGLIRFRQVCFTYRDNESFRFDCDITGGQLTALVGRSGSGKTTFIRLLLGMIAPESGNIINTIVSPDDLYPFAYIPQTINLFNDTIRYNLTYGMKESVSNDQIEAALHAANCDFVYKLPKSYDTVITKQLLSGGQAQRILIARSFLMHSKILVFDEPTSSLDQKTEAEVMQYIKNLRDTRIVIAHKISTIMSADRIIVFDSGSIVGVGNHKSLLTNPFYAELAKWHTVE